MGNVTSGKRFRPSKRDAVGAALRTVLPMVGLVLAGLLTYLLSREEV
jgi:hypothetical protein